MPRAIDPSLAGGGLPVSHDPLNTIKFNVIPNEVDLAELLQQIIDGIIDQIRDFIFPAILELTGIDLSIFLPLFDVLDLDFSSPAAFLTSLTNAFMVLPQSAFAIFSAVLDWLETWIFGGISGEDNTGFPLIFPYVFGAEPNVVTQFFYWIRKFTGIDDFDDLFSLNLVDLLVNFIETLLKPQDLLAWLVDGILPDGQAPKIVHDLIDAVVQGFAGIPIIGPAVQSVWDVINDLFGIGSNAQITGTDNSSEIAKIKAGLEANAAGGVSITDDFDRIVSTNLGAAWTQTYSGSGGGTEGMDGHGYCHWSATGASTRRVVNRYNTPLDTDIQYASFVLRTPPFNFLFATHPRRELILRCNSAGTTYVMVNVNPASVTITPVVGGTIGGAIEGQTGLSFKDGDFYEFFAGTTAEPYRYMVKQNGKTIIDIVDSSHITQIGAAYRYPGFGGFAGVHFLGLAIQDAPPDVAAFAAADRTG